MVAWWHGGMVAWWLYTCMSRVAVCVYDTVLHTAYGTVLCVNTLRILVAAARGTLHTIG